MAGAWCECPWVRRPRRRPSADASSLISHPRTLTPGIPTFTVAVGAKQKQEPCLSGSLRSDRPVRPAGLRGEIKGEASAARRMPEDRSEEHTSELQSLMRISYAVFCLKKKKIPIRATTRRCTYKKQTTNTQNNNITQDT